MTIKKDLTTINFTAGSNRRILGIVLHSMAGTQAGSIAWFKNPAAKASAHYCISKSGEIVQCVEDKNIAWHAGIFDEPIASWLKPNPNNVTIGIELEDEKKGSAWIYPQAQVDALTWLVKTLCEKHNIPQDADHILLHKNLNPSRRSDPVGNFDIAWVLPPTTTPGVEKKYTEEQMTIVRLERDKNWNLYQGKIEFIERMCIKVGCNNSQEAFEARINELVKVDGKLEDALKEVEKQKEERALERVEFQKKIDELTEKVKKQQEDLDLEKKQNENILLQLKTLKDQIKQSEQKGNLLDRIRRFLKGKNA